jgi:hypothetical protein
LDPKIIDSVKPNVAKYTLQEIADANPEEGHGTSVANDTKVLRLGWEHFDPGFSVKMQALCVAPEGASDQFQVMADGYVLGVQSIKAGSRAYIDKLLPSDPFWHNLIALLAFLLAVAGGVRLFYIWWLKDLLFGEDDIVIIFLTWLVSLVIATVLSVLVFGILGSFAPTPPLSLPSPPPDGSFFPFG